MQLDFSDKPISRAAFELARDHHQGIYRKYGGGAYMQHPVRVAETLLKRSSFSDETIAAALLHDCMEDEDVNGFKMSERTIQRRCGTKVAQYVDWLTCPSGGNRAQRKEAYNNRLRQAPVAVRIIKLADILDNVTGIAELDPKFAERYLTEKEAQLKVIRKSSLGPYHGLDGDLEDQLRKERNVFAMNLVAHGEAMQVAEKAENAMLEQLAMEEVYRDMRETAIF